MRIQTHTTLGSDGRCSLKRQDKLVAAWRQAHAEADMWNLRCQQGTHEHGGEIIDNEMTEPPAGRSYAACELRVQQHLSENSFLLRLRITAMP